MTIITCPIYIIGTRIHPSRVLVRLRQIKKNGVADFRNAVFC